MDKLKVHCQRRFSRENVLLKLSKYSTRVFVGVVWCAVLWAFLTTDALPRQYVEYLLSRNPETCIESSLFIPTDERSQLLNFLPSSWNNSWTTDYQLLALSRANDSTKNVTSYQVVLARQDAMCLNVLELKGFTVLTSQSFEANVSADDVPTELLSTASLDLLGELYPDTSSDLLDIPVGHFFALSLLLVVSSVFGVFAKWLFLPQLVGMILAGFLLRNIPGIDFARHISNVWSSVIRNIALIIVLTRGGLSMDFKQLRRLKFAVLLLGFVPCVVEGAVDGLLATFWLKLPWQFAFTLGYIVAAISPSVTVPTTLSLQSQGYGAGSGAMTLIVGAASLDVVITISLFGIFFGLAFSDGSLVLDLFRAPIQIIVGLLYGVIFGLLLWVFPTRHFKEASKVRNRFFLTFGLGLFALFGSTRAVIGGSNLAGSGALGALVLAFVAGQGWDKEEKKKVRHAFYMVWLFFEPLLFGLIGAAVDLQFISPSLVGQAIGLIIFGLIVRLVLSTVVVLGNHFRWLEILFIAIAWLPKATVQAALGPLALDLALMLNNNNEDALEVEYGRQILTVAVLAIVMSAPLGAVATSLLGPVLLKKGNTSSNSGDEDEAPKENAESSSIPRDDCTGGVDSYEVKVEDATQAQNGVIPTNRSSSMQAAPPSDKDRPFTAPEIVMSDTGHEVIELSDDIRDLESEPKRY